jgi:predicted exporter
MREVLMRFVTERPRTVYVLVLLFTLAAAALMPRIHIDTDPENMLPATQTDRHFHNTIEDRFVLHDAIVVGVVNETHPEGRQQQQHVRTLDRRARGWALRTGKTGERRGARAEKMSPGPEVLPARSNFCRLGSSHAADIVPKLPVSCCVLS